MIIKKLKQTMIMFFTLSLCMKESIGSLYCSENSDDITHKSAIFYDEEDFELPLQLLKNIKRTNTLNGECREVTYLYNETKKNLIAKVAFQENRIVVGITNDFDTTPTDFIHHNMTCIFDEIQKNFSKLTEVIFCGQHMAGNYAVELSYNWIENNQIEKNQIKILAFNAPPLFTYEDIEAFNRSLGQENILNFYNLPLIKTSKFQFFKFHFLEEIFYKTCSHEHKRFGTPISIQSPDTMYDFLSDKYNLKSISILALKTIHTGFFAYLLLNTLNDENYNPMQFGRFNHTFFYDHRVLLTSFFSSIYILWNLKNVIDNLTTLPDSDTLKGIMFNMREKIFSDIDSDRSLNNVGNSPFFILPIRVSKLFR